jgi:beta-1,4-N-acetylglucosaminyltransferase
MRTLLVTVGSTQFPQLIDAVIQEEVLLKLKDLGFTNITIQHGSYKPRIQERSSLECFDYKPNLVDYIRKADLIIAHAGAGTAIETLRARKKLIMVPNESLLDNHQLELARKLSSSAYCLTCSADEVLKHIELALETEFVPLPPFEQAVVDSIF